MVPNRTTVNNYEAPIATVTSGLEKLLNEHEVARLTGLSVSSIRRFRLLGTGPAFYKICASVRYKPADITTWLKSCESGPGNPPQVRTHKRVLTNTDLCGESGTRKPRRVRG